MGCGDSKIDVAQSRGTEVNSEQFEDYEISVLNAHNHFRSKHGVPHMTLSRDLCIMAQRYAKHLLELDVMKHSTELYRQYRGEYVGENLGYCKGHRFETFDATAPWYNEITDYDFSSPGHRDRTGPTGHFTQVVWKDSIKLGVGIAMDPNTETTYMVTRYLPGGNIDGEYSKNVVRPR